MTDHFARVRPAKVIELASVAEFTLGTLRVLPSRRRAVGDGAEEADEPRVMQVLIALAEANGAVVSRDMLIERCWGGRIVGEDAISRCVAKVRRLAETTRPPAFTIETIAKVGYRLTRSGEPLPRLVEHSSAVPHEVRPLRLQRRVPGFGAGGGRRR